MLTPRLHKNNFINNKRKIVYLEDAYKKLIFIILILLLTIFFLLPKISADITDSKFKFFNELLINNGFIIRNIEILGLNHLDKTEIIKIIKTYNNVNIFSINIKKIYKEIQNNTWIKKVSIEIIYPNTIKIFLTEKEPIAIWQNKHGNNLITKTGEIILEKNLENFKNYLPIIIGHNAHKNIYSILNVLSSNKDFLKNIWSLTFVNERRWDAHFDQGLTIRLPSKNIKDAWKKVLHLDKNFNILELGLTELDLRNSEQILGKINIDKKLIFKKKS